jgi:lambda repressor-like predicted transcriptional regulator
MSLIAAVSVSDRVLAVLEQSGMTRAELAQRAGMSPFALSRRLVGKTKWKAEELPEIAEALQVSVAELIGSGS